MASTVALNGQRRHLWRGRAEGLREGARRKRSIPASGQVRPFTVRRQMGIGRSLRRPVRAAVCPVVRHGLGVAWTGTICRATRSPLSAGPDCGFRTRSRFGRLQSRARLRRIPQLPVGSSCALVPSDRVDAEHGWPDPYAARRTSPSSRHVLSVAGCLRCARATRSRWARMARRSAVLER